MSEMVFVDGLRVFSPHANAPDWIVAQLVLDPAKLTAWCADQPLDAQGCIRIDLKRAKSGKLYAAMNTYKPTAQADGQKGALPF